MNEKRDKNRNIEPEVIPLSEVEIVYTAPIKSPNEAQGPDTAKLKAYVAGLASQQPQATRPTGQTYPSAQQTFGSVPVQTRKKRQLFETLLDPKTLSSLMYAGGGLLFVGFVVWLWSIGIFKNALFAAACLGGTNLAVLALGIWLVTKTRYQMIGQGITLLSCLVMPLNLWFHHAQGLVTLTAGGHLWIPAFLITLLYAGVARLLADSKFVYALVGGITLTGMLFLADNFVGRFWEIAAPATLLAVIGTVCIHVERLFKDGESPFSRSKFGKAFFLSGHITLLGGLALLAGGQFCGFFWNETPFFQTMTAPAIITTKKYVALALTLLGAYAYGYCHLLFGTRLTEKNGQPRIATNASYIIAATTCSIWAAITLIQILAVTLTFEIWLILLATVGLGLQVLSIFSSTTQSPSQSEKHPLVAIVGIGATLLAGALGASGVFTAIFSFQEAYEITRMYVCALAAITTSFGLGAFVHFQNDQNFLGRVNLACAIGSACLTSAALLVLAGITQGSILLLLMMVLPISMSVVAEFFKDPVGKERWQIGSMVVALGLVGFSTMALLSWTSGIPAYDEFLMSSFYALNTIVFLRSRHQAAKWFGAGTACFALGCLFAGLQFTTPQFLMLGSGLGIANMTVGWMKTKKQAIAQSDAAVAKATLSNGSFFGNLHTLGTIVVGLVAMASTLYGIGQLLADATSGMLCALMAVQVFAALAAAMMDRQTREIFIGLALAQLGIGLFAGVRLLNFTLLDQVEIVVTLVGVAFLSLALYGWYRESENSNQQNDLVTFGLIMGSILSVVPVLIGLIGHRFSMFDPQTTWVFIHNIGVLVIGMVLFFSGILCRIRSTTIAGSTALGLYVLSLVALIQFPAALQSVAVYMMIGGGIFFGTAILLSVYRERLMQLPAKIREGKGVFQVLKWR